MIFILRKTLVIVLFIFSSVLLFSQQKKSVEAIRITTPLVIDGILNESAYSLATPAKDFVQLQPHNGKPSFQPTEVSIFYDQSAIYVGAMLYDSAPDSIFNYLTQRDEIGMSDYVGFYFDPYNQGQLAYGFFITPAGVQIDIKAVNSDEDGEDPSWDAVWESKTRITDEGWVVEMRIPFSELRFSDKNDHKWGLNVFRNIRRYNSNNSWNFVNRNIDGFLHQEGELTGISDVKPPVRLSFSPYLATYLETKKGSKADFLYKGGLDLKYGINESFTLDMMLIPDFGQIQSDDKQLNLSPYELYYSEKRQFFNEGTELFNRANIFYSRRIGASPKFSPYSSLKTNEIVDANPSETQLVNATKVSGRTHDGWGIGVLNAMSLSSFAQVTDTLTHNTRNVTVQPFTNYNVSVIDKTLKNNSFVSLINSNVSMIGNPFRANVTATEFQLHNKAKSYVLEGNAALSSRGDTTYETGYAAKLVLKRTKGIIQYGIEQDVKSDTYNPNDLGYLRRNNQVTTEAWVAHHIIEPFSIFREINSYIWADYNRMYSPNVFYDNIVGYNSSMTFKNNYHFNINGFFNSKRYDYFETRVKGRYFTIAPFYMLNFNASSDSRKPVNIDIHYGYAQQPSSDQYLNELSIETTLRVGQRFEIEYEIMMENTFDGEGFVTKSNNDIVFARRDVNSFENVLSSSYVLSNKASVSLRARHYWSGATNKSYFLLQNDGSLLPHPSFNQNRNQNYNSFTLDMMLRWNFAPGSEMVVSWKNAAFAENNQVVNDYFRNLSDTWLNQSNSLSVKLLYYIDYNSLHKNKKT